MRFGLAAVAALALLAGCASPAKMENMVVTKPQQRVTPKDPSLVQGIYLETVAGGEETNPLWTSEVGNAEFRGALENSLRLYNLLNRNREESTYRLRANLMGVAQPSAGFDMTVTSHVNYELYDRQTNEPYMLETVSASYTAGVGDAFAGIKRLRLANEGSIRENIVLFIDKLLDHPPPVEPQPEPQQGGVSAVE